MRTWIALIALCQWIPIQNLHAIGLQKLPNVFQADKTSQTIPKILGLQMHKYVVIQGIFVQS